jgi:hypothetical protein
MAQSTFPSLCLADSFPLGDGVLFRPISAATPHEPILQDARLVHEQAITLFALGANIKPELRLMDSPIHD